MIKTIVNVEGMNCNMCEEHMNKAIKQAFGVKKVASSHQKKKTIILSIEPIDREKLEAVVTEAGCRCNRRKSRRERARENRLD